jgi:hypothetical protein
MMSFVSTHIFKSFRSADLHEISLYWDVSYMLKDANMATVQQWVNIYKPSEIRFYYIFLESKIFYNCRRGIEL